MWIDLKSKFLKLWAENSFFCVGCVGRVALSFYVLTTVGHAERTILMDTSMHTLPVEVFQVQLRVNFWDEPQRILPMFGGAGDEMDPAAFSNLLRQVSTIMAGVKKEKLKCLLWEFPEFDLKSARI